MLAMVPVHIVAGNFASMANLFDCKGTTNREKNDLSCIRRKSGQYRTGSRVVAVIIFAVAMGMCAAINAARIPALSQGVITNTVATHCKKNDNLSGNSKKYTNRQFSL